MSFARNLLLFILSLCALTSCMITDSVRTIQIEIMKPGIFVIPEKLNTVAVFNRDLFKSDTCIFTYHNGYGIIADSTIRCHDLSNTCVDALSNFFEKEEYFRKVINYRDSANSLWTGNITIDNPDEFFEKTNSDICIFLDFFNLKNTHIAYYQSLYTQARLSWTIAFKTDTSSYVYNQVDTLIFENNGIFLKSIKDKRLKLILMNASEYLGRFFGTKMIPSWIQVERLYYKSNNLDMLQAEKYALENDWLKAAEIWNKETKNKNKRIAAKACYNMALACEMEGKPDVGIDWLVRSYSALKTNNAEHRANCQRYVYILSVRKKEIERLDKQIRNMKNNNQ